jgi:hypothetical protein
MQNCLLKLAVPGTMTAIYPVNLYRKIGFFNIILEGDALQSIVNAVKLVEKN